MSKQNQTPVKRFERPPRPKKARIVEYNGRRFAIIPPAVFGEEEDFEGRTYWAELGALRIESQVDGVGHQLALALVELENSKVVPAYPGADEPEAE